MNTSATFPRLSDSSEQVAEERRRHRRHDLEQQSVVVQRFDGQKRVGAELGQLVDLSSGGMRIRTRQANIRPEQQLRVRLELPTYAGISPFVDITAGEAKPKTAWVGWMTVSRVRPMGNGQFEVGGRLDDMEELDRGMLGLYLSTQPMAA